MTNEVLCTTIVVSILFLIFIWYRGKSSGAINIGQYILIFYIFSIFITYFLADPFRVFSIEASLFFLVILLLFIIPILSFRSDIIKKITLSRTKLFKIICNIFILLGIFSYIYFVPVVFKLLQSDVAAVVLRTDMVGGQSYYETGIFYFIITYFCQFYPIVLIFYFYSVAFTDNSKIFNRLLLFSSTSYIINVLSSIGRDGFILWLMSYLFAYIIFNKFLNPVQKKKQKKLLFGMVGIALTVLVPITLSRFFNNDVNYGNTTLQGFGSILEYAGQQFGNFNTFFNNIKNPEEIGSLNNLFPIMNIGSESNSGDFLGTAADRHFKYGLDINVFGTFLGNFFLELGKWGTFLISLIYFISAMFIFNKRTNISLGRILLITLFCQIPLHGIFYYKLGYTVSNFYMISVLFMSYLLRGKYILK